MHTHTHYVKANGVSQEILAGQPRVKNELKNTFSSCKASSFVGVKNLPHQHLLLWGFSFPYRGSGSDDYPDRITR